MSRISNKGDKNFSKMFPLFEMSNCEPPDKRFGELVLLDEL